MRAQVVLALLLITAPALAGGATVDDEDPPQRMLVSLDAWPIPESTQTVLDAHGATVVDEYEAFQVVLVDAPAPAATLEQIPHVAFAVPDEQLTGHLSESKPAIGLTSEMRQAGLTGEGVNVALVDSGVDASHAGLSSSVVAEKSVSGSGVQDGGSQPSEHGTHVAGVLTGNGQGASSDRGDVSGMAPGAGIISLDISEQFTTSNALRAFEWVYEHHDEEEIRVLANAWGRERAPAEYEPDDPLVRASDALVEDGVVVVFSAGNTGPAEGEMTVEGTNPNVITVGATDKDGDVEDYSSRGPVYEDGEPADWVKPDLVAPGSRIVSTTTGPGGSSYAVMNGTSMAAPHVAGAAALLVSLRPDLTPGQVKGVLLEGASGSGAPSHEAGHGLVDVSRSVEILEQEEHSVVERSASEHQRGELTGAGQGRELLQEASLDDEDVMRIHVPENGTSLAAEVSWDGRSSLEVSVVSPRGHAVESVLVEEEASVHVPDPEQGSWSLELAPQDLDRGAYDVTVEVSWLEQGEGIEIPIADQRTQSGSFPSTGATLDPWASSWIPGVPNMVPLLAGLLLTLAMIVGRVRRSS